MTVEDKDAIDTDILADEAAEIAAPQDKFPQDHVEEPAAKPERTTETQAKPEEAKSEGEGDGETEPEIEERNDGRFVRHGAFHAEREQRKQWQARAREMEANLAKQASDFQSFQSQANERLATLFAEAQKRFGETQKANEPAPPKLEDDPLGYILHELQTIKGGVSKVDEIEKRTTQQQQATAQQRQILDFVRSDEAQFRTKTPDYDAAYEHLKSQWRAEATALGVDPDMAERARIQETLNLAGQLRRSPAELAYQRAIALGYKKGATPKPNGQQGGGPSLETLKAGLKHATNPTGSAPAPSGTPAIDELLRMSDDEFFEKYAGNDDKLRGVLSRL